MHEMSIAVALVDQVIEVARKNHLTRVHEVQIETGVLRGIIPEVMHTAYKMACEETLLENSILKITETESLARCRGCQWTFEPALDNFLCPHCQKADVDILQGDDIILKSVVSFSEDEKRKKNENQCRQQSIKSQ